MITFGGENALMAGNSPSNFLILTKQLCAIGPWAKFELPLSIVRTFGLPCLQNNVPSFCLSASSQAPVLICTTSNRMSLLNTADAKHAPLSL